MYIHHYEDNLSATDITQILACSAFQLEMIYFP